MAERRETAAEAAERLLRRDDAVLAACQARGAVMKVGDRVTSCDERDEPNEVLEVVEVEVGHVSGPTVKVRRLDGSCVYRLARLLGEQGE